MTNKTFRLRTAIAAVFASAMLAGCAPSGGDAANSSAAAGATAAPASGQEVQLVYVEWASCTAATHVAKAALEQQGFKVKTISVSGAAMYSALAHGDADATVCAWLPSTHANYYAKAKDKVTNLGPNMTGTKLGLVVPDYVTIDSIDQLAAHADQFKNRIVGIDPGAGEMGITHQVIKDYKLPLKLIDGSGATMTAALKDAIANHQWIVVPGWTPHWMWARWKLKYLADPKGIYGTSEDIDTLVRKGLKQDMPKAYAVLDGFHWTPEQMQEVMAADQKPNADAEKDAKDWIEAHADAVKGWASTKS
ncbi:MAG: glycine betaine ABC transporter substrate-binding protein [Rhodanobacter sp.]